MIPYSRQFIDGADIQAVTRALKSGWLTQGPTVVQFEKALARYVGSKYAVSFSSGTAALQAAYFAAGLKKGDEIITSPLTFAATANAALWQGIKVVFADIEDKTGSIDPREVAKKITKRTRAIVPVDYAGLPCNYDALKRLAKKHQLLLIEDAAHSLGSTYRNKRIGNIADMTMFSFHPIKSITTGEGGAITTDREDFYRKLIMFRSHGITKDERRFLNKSHGGWYHEMQALGLNYRLTDIQAALGISQLKKLPRFLKARRKIAQNYNKMLAKVQDFILPRERPGAQSAWHLYPLRVPTAKRKIIFDKLRSADIGVQVHYIPVYWHPYYQKLGYKKGLCPKAEEFYRKEISIPIFPGLTKQDQKQVVSLLK